MSYYWAVPGQPYRQFRPKSLAFVWLRNFSRKLWKRQSEFKGQPLAKEGTPKIFLGTQRVYNLLGSLKTFQGQKLILSAISNYKNFNGKTIDYEKDPMSVRNTQCCTNGGSCPAAVLNSSRQSPWYCKFVKPLAFCIITSMLAMSISHLCDKYSASTSFKVIRSDLVNLRLHLNTLSTEVKSVIETRDDLKSKLKEVGCVIPRLSEAILNLRNEVSEGIGLHTKVLLKAMSPESVRSLVKNELQTYDADKTGRTDYALESSGGAILSTRNTETYSAGAPALTLFGIPLCQQKNIPQTIIQTGVLPGECWAFKGSSGSVVIRLLGFVYVSGISLEHIPQSISPTGETTTAPKGFSIWGLSSIDDKDAFLFGEFTYDNTGSPLQYFEVQNESKKPYEIVELKVHSNSGNHEYTCIYRIRVHGTLSR